MEKNKPKRFTLQYFNFRSITTCPTPGTRKT